MPELSTTQAVNEAIVALKQGDVNAVNWLLQVAKRRFEMLVRHQFASFPKLKQSYEIEDVIQESLIRMHRALSEATVVASFQEAKDYFALAAWHIRKTMLNMKELMERRPS